MTRRLRRVVHGGDEGFALLVVLGGMISLSLVVLATLAYVANSLPVTRRGQDAAAAVQAAQAGVDDFLARLSSCDSYWSSPCRPGDVNVATSGWATVPFSSTATPAQYHYEVVRSPNEEAGLLRLRSTGRIERPGGRSTKRTLVVDLRKKSLLEYIYYTDHESTDPAAVMRRYPARKLPVDPSSPTRLDPYDRTGWTAVQYHGVTDEYAKRCNRYWYASPPTPARDQYVYERYTLSRPDGSTYSDWWPYSCDIQFAPIDVLDGPVYTKDAILLNNPLFKEAVSTRWGPTRTPAAPATAPYRIVSGGSGPNPSGQAPVHTETDVTLPPNNARIKERTVTATGGQGGCGYTGPTRIELLATGRMRVTSPLTASTNPACTTGSANAPGMTTPQEVPLPANGVVYVDASSASCGPTSPRAFVRPATDVTHYDCFAGDVFVEGTLSGKLTIAAKNDIVITEDIRYRDDTATSGDVLGLIADGDVEVYHPVACTTTPAPGFSCDAYTDLAPGLRDVTVSAAILSVAHSFTVQNFDRGAKLGTLTVKGGIYQYFRGAVGTGGATGTGYAKDYRFDRRLRSLPPPSFLDPLEAPWQARGIAEVTNPTDLPG